MGSLKQDDSENIFAKKPIFILNLLCLDQQTPVVPSGHHVMS